MTKAYATDTYYVVRTVGKEKPYEIRCTDDPSIVYAVEDSVDQGKEYIETLELEKKVEEAFDIFCDAQANELNQSSDLVRQIVRRTI